MRRIIRKLYYMINSLLIKFTHKGVKVSIFSEINSKTELGRPIKIGRNTYLKGKIGAYSYIGQNCRINAEIGKFCSISENVKIVQSTHPINWVSTSPTFYSPDKQCGNTFATEKLFDDSLLQNKKDGIACKIGNDVWIGENVIIKGGVTIGDGACIGMGAVVTKDIEPYSIVGGVPAHEIRKRFDDKTIERLLKSDLFSKSDEWYKENYKLFSNPEILLEKLEQN